MSANPAGAGALHRAWREYRSMRTALVLLFVLAAGSIFGTLFPQQPVAPDRVTQYKLDHPGVAPLLERLGMFDVFGSPWYTAIYVALVGALVACLVPRGRSLVRMLRARPPRPSARLDRYANSAAFDLDAPPEQALAAIRPVLRGRRFRVAASRPGELAAEKGYLREAGSLLFHVSFLLLLVGFAFGKGDGYRGQMALTEGETRANARVNYDAFTPGRFFNLGDLPPFTLRMDDFTSSFYPNLTPREFASEVTATSADGRVQRQRVAVNHPMTVDGVRVFQSDYGYSPVVAVRGPDGQVLRDGPVLTLRGPGEVSLGAIKLPELQPQVGLQLSLFTGLTLAPNCPGGQPFCNDPRVDNPVLVILPFQGDLQADQAQSVFNLDHSRLRPLGDRPLLLGPGQSGRLANGMVVSFTDLRQYSVFTLARDPGVPIVAVGAALLLAGLIPSLYVTRRRVWVRAVPAGPGTTRVELAGLALQGKDAFADEFAALAAEAGRAARSPSGADRTTLDEHV